MYYSFFVHLQCSGVKDPNLYSNLNPLLESTAAGSNINQPDTGNQFEIAQYPPGNIK